MLHENGFAADPEWFVCSRPAPTLSRRTALELLQQEFHISRCKNVMGEGSAAWSALWLCAHCDVQLLLLKNWAFRDRGSTLRSAALRDLYAVICPVILIGCDPSAAGMLLPNAQIYTADSPNGLRTILHTLKIETKCEQIRPEPPKFSLFSCESEKSVYNRND